MPLIARPRGRRSVGGKLDQIKKQRAATPDTWAVYINMLASILGVPHGMIWRETEEALRKLGSTPLDGMLPWYFRELLALGEGPGPGFSLNASRLFWARTVLQQRTDVRDWYLGTRQARPAPDIMRFTWREACTAANQWHLTEINRVSTSPLPDWVFKERPKYGALIREERRWPNGFWVGYLDVADRSAGRIYAVLWLKAVEALKEIGKRLGHCYRKLDVATNYANNYDMWILFDASNRPCWTAATTSRDERGVPENVNWLVEAKGPGNTPVLPEHFGYLVEFFPARSYASEDVVDYWDAEELHAFAVPGSVHRAKDDYVHLTGKEDGREYFLESTGPGTWRGGLYSADYVRKPEDTAEFVATRPYFWVWQQKGFREHALLGEILTWASEF